MVRVFGILGFTLLWLTFTQSAWAQTIEGEILESDQEVMDASEDASTDSNEGEPRTLVAVLFLATGGVNTELADNLTEVLVASVASSGSFAIVGREQFSAAMGVGGEEETLRCAEDPVCLGRIGAIVGAEEIVLGSLGERAGRYIVNLSRLDVAQARLIHRVFRTTPTDLTPLIAAVGHGAQQLMEPPLGAVRITVNVEDPTLMMDGEEVQPDPDGVLRGLEPGEHELSVLAEGYGEARQNFRVQRGQTLELGITLTQSEIRVVEREQRWYRRWWFWTIVGTVIVGAGAATAIVLTQDESERATGTLGTITIP